jgi:uncharacterized protein YjbJ (UPF0337 family)
MRQLPRTWSDGLIPWGMAAGVLSAPLHAESVQPAAVRGALLGLAAAWTATRAQGLTRHRPPAVQAAAVFGTVLLCFWAVPLPGLIVAALLTLTAELKRRRPRHRLPTSAGTGILLLTAVWLAVLPSTELGRIPAYRISSTTELFTYVTAAGILTSAYVSAGSLRRRILPIPPGRRGPSPTTEDSTMGTQDKAENTADKAKGKVKETTGRAVGNESLEAEGKADQAKGDAKQAAEHAKDAIKDIGGRSKR